MDSKFHNLSLASATHLANAGLITRKHRDEIHAKVHKMKRNAPAFGSIASSHYMSTPTPTAGGPDDPGSAPAMGGGGY
jgi:hypothetical protein